MKRRVLCVFCECRIEGEMVTEGRGYRHPECTKPARDTIPGRPPSPAEQKEQLEDQREDRRHDSSVR